MFQVVQTSGRRFELRDSHSHDAWAVGAVQERLIYLMQAANEYARTHPPFEPAEAATEVYERYPIVEIP